MESNELNKSMVYSYEMELENIPMYIRVTVGVLVIIILTVGTIGNILVTMVISCSRDMKTSTNIFLVNLSVADLLVLLVVTPTALLEVFYHPDIWILGEVLCKVIPFLELLVCHASVLTILAISFERYYAICCPLKVLYVCTKERAVYVCIAVWITAVVITSPMIPLSTYGYGYVQNTIQPRCLVEAGEFLPDLYTTSTIVLFFLLPLIILGVTFHQIAKNLTVDRSDLNAKNSNLQARRQVVMMLGTVVFTFFLCLLPFRLLTMAVLLTDVDFSSNDTYYSILYFSRIMTYINSAVNPILYNIMSSKFRNGFKRLICCGKTRKRYVFHRNGTFLTLTTGGSGINNNTLITNSTSTSSSDCGSSVVRIVRKLESGRFWGQDSLSRKLNGNNCRESML